ncbi:MAG: sugar phosphate isomerase/epimerase [Trueperaceae bacterium]|nr:sugar phosphate isomerase/epimerase [Trueperaceae bacterium]
MKHLRLGVSSYSFWHFTPEKVSLESIFDQAAEMGFMGVEILHQQLESEDNSYLQSLKRHAFRNGLSLYNFGTSQDFVWDDKETRQQNVDHSKHCIDLAHDLGIPSIRINAGAWRRGGWEDLKETRGWTTPWEGFTHDDGFNWAIEGLSACLEHAQKQGVMLLLENHWGLTTTADGMLRILETINSPWLRAILDMGNFYFDGDMYTAMEKIAPWVDLAHAKTYPGGGEVFTIPLDYPRILRILNDAGFKGYLSVEMEGKEAPQTAVPKSMTMLQDAWNLLKS